ncbi:MAG: hypothetical protein H7Y61_20850 [Rhizobiales bacterium]|nr:hypothetical protein [Rhizobacter sp.]
MKSANRLLATALLAFAVPACAADAAERRFIRSGMAEAEVLLKIGPPDHETFIRNERGRPEEKAWAYFPHPGDAQTLTIITLRAGTVHSVDRKISR